MKKNLADVKLFAGGWSHLFGPGRAETHCRVVVDVANDKLVAAQAFDGLKWIALSAAERDDLADSLFDANAVNEDPIGSGLSAIAALPEWASSSVADQKAQPFQVVKPGARTRFDLERPYVLSHHIPHAPAIPGTDMGDQAGGPRYWQRSHAWGWSTSEAIRYTEEGAQLERDRLGGDGIDVVDANVMEARAQVMIAVGRAFEETLPRSEYLAVCDRVRSLPDEHFARVVRDLATTGLLRDALILSTSGLGELGAANGMLSVAAAPPAQVGPDGQPFLVIGSGQDRNTILAALRFYQERGMGEPANRSDAIHDIATNGGEDVSMDDAGIDALCERVNSAAIQPPRLTHAHINEAVHESGMRPTFKQSWELCAALDSKPLYHRAEHFRQAVVASPDEVERRSPSPSM